MAKDLTSQMKAVLKEFDSEVIDAMNDSIDKISKEAIRRLKDTSPKKPGSGKYAKSWGKETEQPRIGNKVVTIYNKRYGWRTHLLEHGHVTRNKKGTYDRTPPHPHIGKVEEWVVDETPKEFEKELNK